MSCGCNLLSCTARSKWILRHRTLHFQDLGLVKLGEMTRLRVQWDRENHRFIFQRGGDPEVVAPYTVSDTAPASDSRKTLEITSMSVANCTATPRPVAFIEALFDDVMVNASAAPPWRMNEYAPTPCLCIFTRPMAVVASTWCSDEKRYI